MNRILTMITLFACVGTMSAQETVHSDFSAAPQQVIVQPQHFGYLSYNDVLHAMPEYAQAMKSLEELKKTYDQEVERSEQDFSKKFTEYLDGSKDLPREHHAQTSEGVAAVDGTKSPFQERGTGTAYQG